VPRAACSVQREGLGACSSGRQSRSVEVSRACTRAGAVARGRRRASLAARCTASHDTRARLDDYGCHDMQHSSHCEIRQEPRRHASQRVPPRGSARLHTVQAPRTHESGQSPQRTFLGDRRRRPGSQTPRRNILGEIAPLLDMTTGRSYSSAAMIPVLHNDTLPRPWLEIGIALVGASRHAQYVECGHRRPGSHPSRNSRPRRVRWFD
jgi:hypothetical protein